MNSFMYRCHVNVIYIYIFFGNAEVFTKCLSQLLAILLYTLVQHLSSMYFDGQWNYLLITCAVYR